MNSYEGHAPGPWRGLRDAYEELHVLAERDRLRNRCGELRGSLVRTEDRLGELARENGLLRDALEHALKGDMDPEDTAIISQILQESE